MSVAIVFLVVLIALFVLAFLTKRRFGVLGLALAAGAMLSELWADTLTPIVRDAGLEVSNLPLVTVVSSMLVLAPALVLLFSGPSYRSSGKRLFGAALFALFAVALLVEPLGSALVLQGSGRAVYEFVAQNQVYIVTAGLLLAIFDLVGAHAAKPTKSDKH